MHLLAAAAPLAKVTLPGAGLPRGHADLHRARRGAARRAGRGVRAARGCASRCSWPSPAAACSPRVCDVVALHGTRWSPPSGAIAIDPAGLFLQGTILVMAFVSLLLVAERSDDVGGSPIVAQAAVVVGSPRDRQLATSTRVQTEVFPLALFAVGGMLLFVVSNNLLLMFIALEVLSLPLYLMAGLARRRRLLSQEAAVKYFLLGAFASAFFLYGLALLYGYANSVDLRDDPRPRRASSGKPDVLLYSGLALLHRRPAVQGRHRAVPQLDARRLPGRADRGHRVHGLVHEGRRVRRDPAGALRRLLSRRRGTGGRSSGRSRSPRWRSARSSR